MFTKNGILILNKPTGMSSFYAVKKAMKLLGANKAGHMGTLDPLGTGVLLVGINKGTKLFDEHLNKTKTYRAIFKFGIETDTLDSEGNIVKNNNKIIELDLVKQKVNDFVGTYDQMPPAYSAKKVNGQKACDLIRKGQEVKLNSKMVTINKFDVIAQVSENTYMFDIDCTAGTYIRSLCRDLAYAMSTCGTMVSIIRTRCGTYNIENACTFEDIQNNKISFVEIN